MTHRHLFLVVGFEKTTKGIASGPTKTAVSDQNIVLPLRRFDTRKQITTEMRLIKINTAIALPLQ
ncbi:hypothetical protein AB4259_09825 [Vibrio amylolyticus]|uniref:hypothetical protein n=1 Tax=Vibrio amylolyticus TaxID=2847292 RepID=UPI00354DBA42